jgi:thioredoxin reductase (NADPH)
MSSSSAQKQDCVVIGGGPAGLTAALYLARFLRTVTVIDAQHGRARMIPMTHNLGAFPSGISGLNLLERMQSHATEYGVTFRTEMVFSVNAENGSFQIETKSGIFTALTMVLATGVVNHRPPLAIKDHDAGLACGLIRYCPVCDGFEIRDKRIAVLGSGNHGFNEARFIRHYSPFVTLIAPAGNQAVARDGISVPEAPLKDLAIVNQEVVVTLKNGQISRFDALYVALGTTPNSDLALALGLRMDHDGYIVVDDKQKTSIDRVYAIGDVVQGLDQIATAMGQGAAAATAIHNELRDA